MYKGNIYGKIELIDEPFQINNRNYCKAKCNFCGRIFVSQLRLLKKGRGCRCKINNLSYLNKKIGKLRILEFFGKRVKCECECGNIKFFYKNNVLSGTTNSCGCEKKKILIKRNTKHNKSRSRIYQLYLSMKRRCYDNYAQNYRWYGGKGIKVCDEWLGCKGFQNFYDWSIINGYNDKLSIERIDVNGNYCPENCKWITIQEQHLNTSKTIRIICDDGIKYVQDLSEKYNIPKSTLYQRIKMFKLKNNTNIIKEGDIIWVH